MAINIDVLNEYGAFNWERLLRKDLGESGRLDEVEPNLQRIRIVFDKILSYESVLSQIPDYEREFQLVIQDFITDFNLQLTSSYSDVTQRNSKLNLVRQKEKSIIDRLGFILNYLQFSDKKDDFKEIEIEKKSEEIAIKLNEADSLIGKVKEAITISNSIAEKQEVALYGKEFDNMATKNGKAASKNQWLMIIFLFLTVLFACFFVFGQKFILIDDNISLKSVWNLFLEQNVLFKMFLISAGGYLVAHFSRNYSAEMNMFYINKHRQLALNSHQRIIDAARSTETQNEAETKNAILLQVAKTMFDVQDSGYLKNGNNPIPTTQVIETIRTGITK